MNRNIHRQWKKGTKIRTDRENEGRREKGKKQWIYRGTEGRKYEKIEICRDGGRKRRSDRGMGIDMNQRGENTTILLQNYGDLEKRK